jgi:hypothetical protein
MRSAYIFTPALMVAFATSASGVDLAAMTPPYTAVNIWSLLNNPQAKNELKITKAQEKGIQAAIEKWKKASSRDDDTIYKWRGPDKEAKIRALRKQRADELFGWLGATLKPEQIKRLKQIMLQQQGMTVLDHPEIREALKLNGEQVKNLKTIFEKARNDLAAKAQAGRISRQEGAKQYMALGFGVPEQVREALTEQQRQTLKELLGEPYPFQ